jgi:hypothetical protein
VSTSNVAVEIKAPVKVNVEDKVDGAGSAFDVGRIGVRRWPDRRSTLAGPALARLVLSGGTSSVA